LAHSHLRAERADHTLQSRALFNETYLRLVGSQPIDLRGDPPSLLKIIASIEEPQLIAKILSHLERAAPEQYQSELALGARGPPLQPSLL
jgi:hypothetical protein